MLAHKGMEEGVMVAERIAGKKPMVNYDCIPSVIYTHPEIAWVGKTEQEVKGSGEAYNVGSFNFCGERPRARGSRFGRYSSRSLRMRQSDRILGVHILGSAGIGTDRTGGDCDGVLGECRRPGV